MVCVSLMGVLLKEEVQDRSQSTTGGEGRWYVLFYYHIWLIGYPAHKHQHRAQDASSSGETSNQLTFSPSDRAVARLMDL